VTQPDPQQIAAALDAMRGDATMWREMAGEMRSAAAVADRLDLTKLHFSKLGEMLGMVDLYRDVQDRMIQLMNQGADNFDATATALNTAADGYDKDERDNVHRFTGIY
jgi:hypothetical protein